MRMSLAGNSQLQPAPQSDAGFTLVELLAVLVIMALMASAVVMSLGPSDGSSHDYSETLVQEFNAASQQSILTGVSSAIGLSEDGYAVMHYTDGEWILLNEREWPDFTRVNFQKDERDIDLSEDLVPLILLSPTGENTAFELNLINQDQDIRLVSQGDGRIMLERDQ